MSYLTKLHFKALTGTPEERIEVLNKISETLELTECDKDDFTIRDEYYRSTVDEDVMEAADVTKGHPDVIISIIAEGEERTDLWHARMQDGRYERQDANINDTLPAFEDIILPEEKKKPEPETTKNLKEKLPTVVYSASVVEKDGYGGISIHQFISDCPGGNLIKIQEFLRKQCSERGLELYPYDENGLLKLLGGENEDDSLFLSAENWDTDFFINAKKTLL